MKLPKAMERPLNPGTATKWTCASKSPGLIYWPEQSTVMYEAGRSDGGGGVGETDVILPSLIAT